MPTHERPNARPRSRSRTSIRDGSMERSILGRGILVLVLLGSTISLTARSSFGETGAECRASPRASASQGMHWYYRVDRTNNRHCWFLSSGGIYVRSNRIVATPNRPLENAAKRAWAPHQNEIVQTASSQLASAGTVKAETQLLEQSVRERTATDFVGRWLDLPKSLDLDARESATPRNNNADEHTMSDFKKQIPSNWFVAADTSGGLRQSAATANFGSIFLGGALGALLFGGVLKLTRRLHTWPALTPKEQAHDPGIGLSELMRALRRGDEKLTRLDSRAVCRSGCRDPERSKNVKTREPSISLFEQAGSPSPTCPGITGELTMILSLRVAATASVMAAVASTSVMAQTTGTIPQPPPSVVTSPSPPPTTNQFSSNELIDAGSRFFGGVSQGLAMISAT
jgi:hypothetical protein